jgi:hypothetical protein
MMDRARQHYQDRAMECLLVAEEIRDPAERLKMLGLAQKYILLAVHVGLQLADRSLTDQPTTNDA